MPSTDPITVPIRGKDELTPALKTASGGMGGFIASIKQSAAGLQDVRAAIGLVGDGLRVLQQGYTATVGVALSYADTVRKLSRTTGQSAEDTSRLIQLTDDLGVEMGDLENAASAAARKGIAFNTESIAKLADQYQRISDPVARNTLLIDNFGRSGLNMAAAMEKGGAAIRSMSSAVDSNLILTQTQINQARELEIALDNLGDTWTGITVQVGTALIPNLNAMIMQLQVNNKMMAEGKSIFDVLAYNQKLYNMDLKEATAELNKQLGIEQETTKAVNATATATSHKYVMLNGKRTEVANNGTWGQQSYYQQTMTVKNEATLNVKVTATGLDASSNWSPIIQKTIRDMQSAGIIPKATR